MDKSSYPQKCEIILDIGCQKTTEYYDRLPPDAAGEDYALELMTIEKHKLSTQAHSPECFVNRTRN